MLGVVLTFVSPAGASASTAGRIAGQTSTAAQHAAPTVSAQRPTPPAVRKPIIAAPRQGQDQARADRPDPRSQRAPAANIPSAPTPSGTWQPLGPAPIGPPYTAGGGSVGGANSGRVTGLAYVPGGSHPGRTVAASAGGGIWTSDDGGSTWTARTDSSADLAVGSVTDDPTNNDHLIAGTGEDSPCGDCFAGAGILSSTDGGTTWALQNPGGVFSGVDVGQVAIDPSNANHEFAATSSGLYVTTDGGTSWAKPSDSSYPPVDGNVTAVVIDPTTTTTVYIGGGAAIVAKSTDGGVHWVAANMGIPTPGTNPLIALSVAKSSPSMLYVSVGSDSPVAPYKTSNGGASWAQLTAAPDYTSFSYGYGGGSGGQGWYDNVVAVDPTNANHVIAGGIALVETTDGGTSWTNVNGQSFSGTGTNTTHPDQHALAFRPDGSVWVGNDGGVFLYTPSSGAVTNTNGNLNITQFYFGFNAVGDTVLAGAQDNSSARTSSPSLGAWTGIFGGDGGPSAITSNQTSTQFIEDDGDLFATTNGFASAPNYITPTNSRLFTPPMIVVPNTTTPSSPTVFYGGANLYRTTNPTAPSPTWAQVTKVAVPNDDVSAIAASPSNSQVVYVGFADGTIEMSIDGGVTFTPLAATPSSPAFVTGISVDPSNPAAITASFSYSDTRYRGGLPHVYQYSYSTSPGSGTWTTISGNLPQTAVSKVAYVNGALVAATDVGVYATGAPAGSSTSWKPVGTGLPNVQVQDLYLEGTTLYVVTHGRGAWKLPITYLAGTTTTLFSVLPNPSLVAQPVTFKADVVPSAQGTPTGTVSFNDGTTALGTSSLVSNVASFTTSALSAGTHSITATYNGDSNFAPSVSNTRSLTVVPGSAYTAVTPARLADTRCAVSPAPSFCTSENLPTQNAGLARVPPGGTIDVQVTGIDGVPDNATAAVINLTALDSSPGYLTAYPTGSPKAVVSSVNWTNAAGGVPNMVTVAVGPNGKVTVFNNDGSNDVVVDIDGYYSPQTGAAGQYFPAAPARLADTRCAGSPPPSFCASENLPAANGTLATVGPNNTINVQVAGVGGVPSSGVGAVVLNLTAVAPSSPTYLTAYPAGSPKAVVSNLNVSGGEVVANRVTVGISSTGQVSIYNYTGSSDAVVDVVGWYSDGTITTQSGALFDPINPSRLADTRCGGASPPGFCASENLPPANGALSTLGPGGTMTVVAAGLGGIPGGASAVDLNTTVADGTAPSYLTVWPDELPQPVVSDLNWTPGDLASNATLEGVIDGRVDLYNNAGSVDTIVDVDGYFVAATS